jgi:hypothetical protein
MLLGDVQCPASAGVLCSRSSSGLLGMQPVIIYSGDSVAFKPAITLDTIKVG